MLTSNVPVPPAPFIGRVDDLAEISRRLSDPACQLVTLVGPGGIGRTRLAIKVVEQTGPAFVDGAYFVSLAPLTDPESIGPAIASVVGLSCSRNSVPPQALLDYLRNKQALLALDTFEHLLSGVNFVGALLEAAPTIKILVTSCERLNLQKETLFYIGGLTYPDQATTPDADTFIDDQDAIDGYQRAIRLLETAGLTWEMSNCLLGVSKLLANWGRIEPAVELLAVILEQYATSNTTRDAAKRFLTQLQSELSSRAFTAVWERGRRLDYDGVFARILDNAQLQKPARGKSPDEPLSSRELEVLHLASDGLSNAEIARTLYVTVGTVKIHMSHIYGKLGVNSRAKATALAQRLSIL